jgi:hypothetical protein
MRRAGKEPEASLQRSAERRWPAKRPRKSRRPRLASVSRRRRASSHRRQHRGHGIGLRREHAHWCLAVGGARWGRFLGRREGEQGHKRSGGPLVPCERPGLLARRGLQGQAGVGARSVLRRLTRRGCLNEANAVSAVSFAARPRTEHRSAVGAQRRPPQHEPPPGTACRDARTNMRHHAPAPVAKPNASRTATGASAIIPLDVLRQP